MESPTGMHARGCVGGSSLAGRRLSMSCFLVGLVCLIGCARQPTFQDAEAALLRGEDREAIALFTELAASSNDPAILGNRAKCYSNLGELDAALEDFHAALELAGDASQGKPDPILPFLYYHRGQAYHRADLFEKAVEDYEKAIAVRADYPDARNNLAWLLATCADPAIRNPQRALELSKWELREDPQNASVMDTVAASWAAVGDFAAAIAMQEKAILKCDDLTLREQFQQRRKLYEQGNAFVE